MLRSRLSGTHTNTCSQYPIPDSRRARTHCGRVYSHLRYALQPRLVTDLASLIRVYTVWSDVVTLQHEYVCMRPHKYRAASGVRRPASGVWRLAYLTLVHPFSYNRSRRGAAIARSVRYRVCGTCKLLALGVQSATRESCIFASASCVIP